MLDTKIKIAEKKFSYLIQGFFTDSVIAGFSKNNLSGDLQTEKNKLFSFCKNIPKLTYLNQTHSAQINRAKEPGYYQGDGIFSKNDNLALSVKTADCLPIFFHSFKLNLIGMVHMGWRSAKSGILEKIDHDLSSFKVLAGVGMRKCCYQVQEEFLSYPEFLGSLEKRGTGLYFDPIKFAKKILLSKGLKENNFFDLGICSRCKGEEFFSYRKDKTDKRTISFIVKSI